MELDVSGLQVTYAGVIRALRDIDLRVGTGEIVAVLGSNGAGKTTLLRAVTGSLKRHRAKVDKGQITFGGRSLVDAHPADVVNRGVVLVPEGRRVFGRLSVEENLKAGAITVRSRATRAERREKVYGMFPRLAERSGQRAALLSGGEQQMLAIGRALMSGPRLLLLDEPSLGLAPQIVTHIGEVLKQINQEGTSVMLVEQNAAMALGVADNGYVLELGRVELSGPAAELAASDDIASLYLGRGHTGGTDHDDTPARPDRPGGPGGPGDGAGGAASPTGTAGGAAPRPTLSRWTPPARGRFGLLGAGAATGTGRP
ncbi:ABC transporter ATP-binding protein [Parafrankia elaeagni]|uniref:ABC transporter ATP-binding protein n=1 Tax=Parafrankia elaeagni TaxID=222534 RepID=UPI00036C1222|nr:ABC transporter ATP-binding protein [Parafrankia elaeagni]